MKIFLDTNILISAMVWPNSNPSKAYFKAVSYPNTGMICEQTINEMRRVFNKKFSQYTFDIEKFLSNSMFSLEFVPAPSEPFEEENQIRDPNDRPLLRAAIKYGADIFLTGDKDFLESGVQNPKIISVSDFLELE